MDRIELVAVECGVRTLVSSAVAAAAADISTFRATLTAWDLSLVANAVPSRQAEFAAGRWSASQALAQLGFPRQAIGISSDRTPIWPNGAIGSISHSADVAAAVVARVGQVPHLGLDVEERGIVEWSLRELISRPDESGVLEFLDQKYPGEALSLLFSIKEAAYKAAYPAARRIFGFHDAAVVLMGEERALVTFCVKPTMSFSIVVRYMVSMKHVIAVASEQSPD